MITTKLYLDRRSKNKRGESPVKICIANRGYDTYLQTGVRIQERYWDKYRGKVMELPNRTSINNYLASIKTRIDNLIMELTSKGELAGMTVTQIKNLLAEKLNPREENNNGFIPRFVKFMESKEKQSTKEKYAITLKRIKQYDGDFSSLKFEDITKDWLSGFDTFLMKTNPAKNSRNIHFRNIRAVFNDAIDNGITQSYPFRKFKIRPERTIKRSLSIEQLRELFNYRVEHWQERYLDYFKLEFYLIGINTIDLCHLTAIDNKGRINYKRAKTGRLYSIKVEPEALDIISKHQGKAYLLDILDGIKDPHAFTGKFNKGLQSIGTVTLVKNEEWKPNSKKHKLKKMRCPSFPGLSAYWARHTWATIAAELDIPKETIAAALGHGGNTVTDIYIDFDSRKIDEANRRVIDYVLYCKV